MPRCDRRVHALAAGLVVGLGLSVGPAVANARGDATENAVEAVGAAATPAGSPVAPTRARPLQPGEEEGALPAGHPRVAAAQNGEEEPDEEDSPHAGPGMWKPPPDTSQEDPRVPAGALAIEVRDAEDKPAPNLALSLTTLHQSVAKGQSKDSRPLTADAAGLASVDHLETGSSVSYWVKYQTAGATFASVPVQLNAARGVRVVLHVYPVVHEIETALVVAQGAIYFEVKDDRVQVEEAITFFNFGKTAWVPDNLVIKLPAAFTALTSQAMMSDQGVDSVDKHGAKIRGTFAPGRHDVEFRWQLPYDGEKDLSVDVNVPPHAAVFRVMAAAGKDTTLDVGGFPEAQKRTDRQGQRVLVTEKQVERSAPLTSIHVSLRGLTVAGPARIVATGLAGLGVMVGILVGVGRRGRGKGAERSERAVLLSEIEELERAHRRGDVGPKAYARIRRELVDAIAQTLDPAT